MIKNTMLDDICAVIGLNATLHLVVWYGNDNLYIPNKVDEKHFLSKLIGLDIARKLCREWPSQIIQVPTLRGVEDLKKRKEIVRMAEQGFGVNEIANVHKMTTRRVEQILKEFERAGLVCEVRRPAPVVEVYQPLLPGFDDGADEKMPAVRGEGWPGAMRYKIETTAG